MRRILPAPVMAMLVLTLWLALNNSVSLGNLLFGALLGIVIPLMTAPLRESGVKIHDWRVLVSLTWRVAKDIVISNITVARQVLGRESALDSRFVWVPLTATEPHAIVALAGIITLTPGTVTAFVSEDRRHLLVHALHVTDTAALVSDIKTHYEAPLMKVFGDALARRAS
jgi:multicomponent K+:H+ antiporter subunit E